MSTYESFSRALHEHLTGNPNSCVFLGVDKHLGELPDPSMAAVARRLARARDLLTELASIDKSRLDFDRALDLDLAALRLEAEILDDTYTFNGRTRLPQMPTAGDDIGDGIFNMFINDPRSDEQRLVDIASRIEAVPAYLDALLGRLDHPVSRWVDIDIGKCRGLPQLFETLLGWAADCGWTEIERLKTATELATTAIDSYVEKIEAMPKVDNIHVGDETMRKLLRLRGIEQTPEELHRMATEFLAETRAIIGELRDKLVAKYELDPQTSVADLHAYLNKRFRVKVAAGRVEDVLERYQAEKSKILSFCVERQLFPIFDEQDLKILRTPPFMAPSIPAGAMMPPAPFRKGVRTSLIYLTLSEALLDEHTELDIPGMMIHEGIPGHHLQLATASTHPSQIRRHIQANDHAEGWTTMLEDYMLDMGYMGELTDEARFCGKRDISRLGARVAIDLFFMSGDRNYLNVGVDCDISPNDPFVAAGGLLTAVTGFVADRVQAELNWYSQERAYPLSYLTGNRVVWALKNDVIASQSGAVEGVELDRKFHRVYLESGNMPVSFLRRLYRHHGLLAA